MDIERENLFLDLSLALSELLMASALRVLFQLFPNLHVDLVSLDIFVDLVVLVSHQLSFDLVGFLGDFLVDLKMPQLPRIILNILLMILLTLLNEIDIVLFRQNIELLQIGQPVLQQLALFVELVVFELELFQLFLQHFYLGHVLAKDLSFKLKCDFKT